MRQRPQQKQADENLLVRPKDQIRRTIQYYCSTHRSFRMQALLRYLVSIDTTYTSSKRKHGIIIKTKKQLSQHKRWAAQVHQHSSLKLCCSLSKTFCLLGVRSKSAKDKLIYDTQVRTIVSASSTCQLQMITRQTKV